MTRRATLQTRTVTGITWGVWAVLLLASIAYGMPWLFVACTAFAALALACWRERHR